MPDNILFTKKLIDGDKDRDNYKIQNIKYYYEIHNNKSGLENHSETVTSNIWLNIKNYVK